MILKSDYSESFDIFYNNIQIKKASLLKNFIKALDLGKGFDDAVKMFSHLNISEGDMLKNMVKKLQSEGKSADDIAKYLKKDVGVINSLMEGSVPKAITEVTPKAVTEVTPGTVQEVAEQSAKALPEIKRSIESSISEIREQATNVTRELNKIEALESSGADSSEIAESLLKLKNSRDYFKNRFNKIKQELGTNQKLNAEYATKISRMESILDQQMDAYDNILKRNRNIVEELAGTTEELSSAKSIISKLEEANVLLRDENKKLIEEAIEYRKEAQKLKELTSETIAESGESPASKIGAAKAAEALQASEEAAKKVINEVPKSKPLIEKGLDDAKKKGADEAKKIKDKGRAKNNYSYKKRTFLQDFLLKYSGPIAKGLVGSRLFLGLSGAAMISPMVPHITVLVGAGLYFAYWMFYDEDPSLPQDDIYRIMQLQVEVVTRANLIKFIKDSDGQAETKDLLDSVKKSYRTISNLYRKKTDSNEETFNQALRDLGDLQVSLLSYISNTPNKVVPSLEAAPNNWEPAWESINALSGAVNAFGGLLYNINMTYSPAKNVPPSEGPTATPDRTPVETPGVEVEDTTFIEPITIFDRQFETSTLNNDMKNVLSGMLTSIIASPEGLAFLDPVGGRGIFGRKYLDAIRYLYRSGVSSPGQITKLVDRTYGRKINNKRLRQKKNNEYHQLMREYRGNLGQWRSSLNESARNYRNRVVASQNLDFFTQKFIKPANSNVSGVIYNGKRNDLSMQKKADKFSKQYYQDAVTDLDDQYAKSYYAGLKSMYDQNLGRTEADYQKLYKVHDRSGADLIGAAHPKSVEVADAMGRGGLVENQIEQQRHSLEVAHSVPSGNFRGRHAWVINNLVKLADQTDERGLVKASDLIDAALKKLASL